MLARRPLGVVELGGGALGSERTRATLAAHAFTVHLETSPDEAWERVAGSGRPLARDPEAFRALFEERRPLYESADASATDLDGVVLAAAGVHFAPHRELNAAAVIADAHVAEVHAIDATRTVPRGEAAKTLAEAERLWRALTVDRGGDARRDRRRLDDRSRRLRRGHLPARDRLDRGAVDARRPGRRGDRREGRHRPARGEEPRRRVPLAVPDRDRPDAPRDAARGGTAQRSRRGREDGPTARRAALGARHVRAGAHVCRVQVGDLPPRPLRPRRSGAAQPWPHVCARARSCVRLHASARPSRRARTARRAAASRVSTTRPASSSACSRPRRSAVDRDAAWAALQRDKKAVGGAIRLVLLEMPGSSRVSRPRSSPPASARLSTHSSRRVTPCGSRC